MMTEGDALARATMNALLDELQDQAIEGAELLGVLLSIVGMPASLAAINGVGDKQIGDEALNGVIHGRMLLFGQAGGSC
ncbi:hypothetical protein KIH24_05620 [Rhizobiales bacterium TNE-4]|nr:hypothetical protein [Rhizobiales bacterium TNE-4]MBV1827101.1 hypothetical protein [Rhizobiales bacterium TNE-4]